MAKYAIIKGYGHLVVPVSLLEKVSSTCFIGETRWSEEGEQLTKLSPLKDVMLMDKEDIDVILAQQELEGNG